MLVQHKIHNTDHWYTIDTCSDLATANRRARSYALNNGGETRIVEDSVANILQAMKNQSMRRKLENREAIDVSSYKMDGSAYVLDRFIADVDYCNAVNETWIWSIGRRKSDGVILASPSPNLYQNNAFECLWLR